MAKQIADVTHLVFPDCEGRPTVEISVLGRRFRVLIHALEASPVDYLNALSSATMRDSYPPWRCVCCGRETETHYNLWTPLVDVLCDSCRRNGDGVPRRCPYCGQPLVKLLPVDVAGSLRYVVVCPLHHCYMIPNEEASE